LGLKKAVDIVLIGPEPKCERITIDVKGEQKTRGGWYGVTKPRTARTHFFVFVDYRGDIRQPEIIPEIYVVPSEKLESVSRAYAIKPIVQKTRLAEFRDRWDLLGLHVGGPNPSANRVKANI
jgi:hypothetical protein